MTNLTDAPGTRLFTSWGTVLYVDVASGELRHGPIDRSPQNARFAANGADGQIMHEMAGSCRPIVFPGDRSRTIDPGATGDRTPTPTIFESVPLREQWIGLKADGLFLCAEPDGRITLSRQACGAWERFRLPGSLDSAQKNGQEDRFARRRVIVVRHRGNLANKMFQYMGALTLASRIKGCTIVNVTIPEWGIEIPDDTQYQLFFDNIDLWTWDPFRPNVEELCAVANRSQSIRIMMADHLQRMEFLMPPQFYEDVFPKSEVLSHELAESDLLINIRTAEILDGVPHYPVPPIAFYEDVVARTGLNPVFVGQLGDSEYVRRLRSRFPRARFIDSQGARADFDLIRSAKNIVVAISTFSWLAAWLSQAKTIILPISGFYNPAQHRELDLLPVDDVRYRFFLFPLNFGVPQKETLEHHQRMNGRWKEISRNQVALLKNAAPFLRVPRQNFDGGLPSRAAPGAAITFDPVWYAHEYIDAAMEISEGWFEDPLHHYLEVGRLRGYLPTRPVQQEVEIDLSLPNLALNKRATQSSLSRWSKGSTPEQDAANAVDGNPSKDYGFHTEREYNPWWMVDLGARAEIRFIRIFNRQFVPEWMQQRASPLVVEVSNEGDYWTLLFRTKPGQLFGGYSGGQPLLWRAPGPIEARFIRISIPRQEELHLAEVEVYGRLFEAQSEAADAVAVLAKPATETSLPRYSNSGFPDKERVRRVLFFVGTGWAFGSVHFELVKYLHSRGLVADVLDFGRGYNRDEMAVMAAYYDCVVGILGETWPLIDNYGIPHEKIVVIAHGEYDLQHALETRPPEEIDRFAGYGVISEWLLQLSAELGIRRIPKIVKYGVNYQRFLAPLPAQLRVVGYGGSMHRADPAGVDWKRGVLAQEAAEAAGLVFMPAGRYHYLAMPQYYRQVDAVLVTSLREGFGLPAMEAAAAGRLVISTSVGGFPDQAARGAGITAPLAADEFKEFVIDKLNYYKGNPAEYREMCGQIQEAAKCLDWEYTVDDWIELIRSVGPGEDLADGAPVAYPSKRSVEMKLARHGAPVVNSHHDALQQIHLINLDRSTTRLALFRERNAHLENVVRVSAVDGSTVDRDELIANGTITDDLPYWPGSLGNALSHLNLWRKAVAENRGLTIFEDDVICSSDFYQASESILVRLPADWDIVQWGYNHDPLFVWVDFGFSKAKLEFYDRRYRGENFLKFQSVSMSHSAVKVAHSFGTMAYSISPKGAQALLQTCLPLRNRVIAFPGTGTAVNDLGIDNPMAGAYVSMQAFLCLPPLVLHDNQLPSDNRADGRGH